MPSEADSTGTRADKSPRDMLLGGLVFRRVRIRAREVVFVKGVIEASEGLAVVFADSGGDLTIATSPSQERALDELLQDLERDLALRGEFMATTESDPE